jgi:hypothetical protein
MLALSGAFFTAALALIGNIVYGLWTRYRERRGVAAALAGEIAAYVTVLDAPTTIAAYRRLATLEDDTRRRRLRAMVKPPQGHPVYDKVADKIGLLPVAEALEVSAIYNVVTGLRILLSNLSSDEFANVEDDVQVAYLNKIAEGLEKYCPRAEQLVARLNRISNGNFWQYLRS